MCLRIRAIFVVVLVAIGFAAASAPARGNDAVAAYLERHGLLDLLATHLEERIDAAEDEHREALILRLSRVLTALLEQEHDPAQRLVLEQRSRRLLELAPADSADELRLALLGSRYEKAERVAENHRLRLADAEDLAEAQAAFGELIEELDTLRAQLERAIDQMQRQLSRAPRSESATLQERLDRRRQSLAQSRFLAGWSRYYLGWLTGDRELADLAQRTFAELLMADTPYPQPADISVDVRRIEPLARSILGLALARSMTATSTSALNLLELLEHEHTAPAVRDQVPGWRLVIHLEHLEYLPARLALEAAQDEMTRVPLAWLRLAAVHGLMGQQTSPEAATLARFAVTALAARGELQQVLELAEDFGIGALGDRGFARHFISGLIAYRQARELHGEDEPTDEEVLQQRYREAVADLRRALEEPDRESYPDAQRACRRLIAWALYYQDHQRDAHEAFIELADQLRGDDAQEALWMAIVSLDRLMQQETDPQLRRRHDQLVDRFTQQHAGTRRASILAVNRAARSDRLTQAQLEELLAVPSAHEAYGAARRRAAAELYRRFVAAGETRRQDAAAAFLSVASPLLLHADAFGDAADPESAQRRLSLVRQILDVALHRQVERASAATAALESFQSLMAQLPEVASVHEPEMRFRRVQILLLEGDVDGADEVAESLWTESPNSVYALHAARAVFQFAHRQAQASAAESLMRHDANRLLVRHGGRVLHEFEQAETPLAADGALPVTAAVAQASLEMWRREGSDERGRAAKFLYRALLDSHPGNRRFLRAIAELTEAFDEPREALQAWRRLVAGSESGTDAWYEARYHQLRLLSGLQPQRARQAMEQHRRLHPDYGPEPWGTKLRELDAALQGSEEGN